MRKDGQHRPVLTVTALPTPGSTFAGVTVRLSSDGKPYYCDGTTWTDLTATTPGLVYAPRFLFMG